MIDSVGRPHVAGARLPPRTARGFNVFSPIACCATHPRRLRDRAPRDTTAKSPAAMGAAGKSTEIQLAGREFVGQSTPLLSARGAPVGGFVALRSLDAELAPFRALRKTLLITGALGLIVAFLLSGVVARQIVRPVKSLVSATRRAADGDYAAEIPAGGSDEIGTLADAVRRLLGDLRDKQALVDFLGGGGAMSNATLVRGADPDATVLLPGAAAPRAERSARPDARRPLRDESPARRRRHGHGLSRGGPRASGSRRDQDAEARDHRVGCDGTGALQERNSACAKDFPSQRRSHA